MARLTLSRETLLPALALAGRAVARNSTIPVLQNLMLSVEGGRLRLTGSDLDAEISADTPCSGPDLATTLPAGTLHDAVKKLPDGAEIALDIEPVAATLSSGRSRFRLPVLPASDFPLLSAGTFSHEFKLSAAALGTTIDSVFFAISTEETRYYLNGIHWHQDEAPEGPVMIAVATDGHRLAKLSLHLPEGAAGMPAVIVPRRTIALLKNVLPAKGDVSVSLSATKLRFSTDGGTLTSKLIDGTFPEYKRVVPVANPNRFRIGRAELASALDRVTTITAARGAAVKFTFGDELMLTAANPDSGSAEETVPLEKLEGEAVETGFNGRYCLDMLAATDAKSLVFALELPGSPALVTPESGEASFVLMPMRTS